MIDIRGGTYPLFLAIAGIVAAACQVALPCYRWPWLQATLGMLWLGCAVASVLGGILIQDRRASLGTFCILAGSLLYVAVLAYPLPVYRVRGYVCVHTGSCRGYREWVWGRETRHWYRQSKLETFMQAKHPDELKQKWVSYSGTGVNCFGRGVSCSHGRPGPIVLIAVNGTLDEHVVVLTDPERKALYDLFVSGNSGMVWKRVDQIRRWHAERAPPAPAGRR